MGSCCQLEMIEIDGVLCCAQCNRPVARRRKESTDSMRCEVRYSCSLCGKERYIPCGREFTVQFAGGATKKVRAE